MMVNISRKIMFILVVLFVISTTLKAEFGDWVTYSAITKTTDILEIGGNDGNSVAYATNGGVFSFNSKDGYYKIIDNDDGLYNVDISNIEIDFRGVFWAVNTNGAVTLFSSDFKEYKYLEDLPSSGAVINRAYSSDEFVYLAADNVFVRYKFDESYGAYQVKDSNLEVEDVSDVVVFDGDIYIATGTGIYFIDESVENISALDPLWTLNNLPNSIKTNKFFIDSNKLYALTIEGIYEIDKEVSSKVVNGVVDKNILDAESYESELYFLSGDTITSKDNLREMYKLSDISSTGITTIFSEDNFDGTDNFVIKDDVVYLTGSIGNGIKFHSLSDGLFSDMNLNLPFGKGLKKGILDRNNNLIYSANHYFNYYNIYEDNWQKDSTIREYLITNIFEDSKGNYFTGQWNYGLSQYYMNENDSLKHIRDYYLGDPNYLDQHPDIGEDSKGNIWVSNWWAGDIQRPCLIKLTPATIENPDEFSYEEYDVLGMTTPYELYIDNYDWIWLGSSEEFFAKRHGLAVCKLKENGDFVYSHIPEFNEGIISIVKDQNDIVWIGTNNGLKYINVSSFSSSSDPINITFADYVKSKEGPIGSFIFDIEVNSLNEKWLATDRGVSVLSGDGTTWRHYVAKDFDKGSISHIGELIETPILDSQITQIIFDEDTGIVIFVSSNGISFFDYAGVSKDNKMKQNIATIPSPFMNNGYSVMKFIIPDNGKFYDSAKIFDLRGRLVKGGLTSDTFKILNGWNGKDNDGKIVSSGVYQVVVYDSNNPEEKLFGKIAVVRKR